MWCDHNKHYNLTHPQKKNAVTKTSTLGKRNAENLPQPEYTSPGGTFDGTIHPERSSADGTFYGTIHPERSY